ncbi:MAG: hypothetical protein V2B18_22410 [Pseudomonadota bacterium]
MEMLERKLKRPAEVAVVQQEHWEKTKKESIEEVERLFDEVESRQHVRERRYSVCPRGACFVAVDG